jgi:hypothetical protein
MSEEPSVSIKSYRLFEEIILRSESDEWDEAKKEWYLAYIEIASEQEVIDNVYVCLCGHKHLKELCYLRNKINKTEALVGNCCVKKFMKLDSDDLFKAIKRNKTNPITIEHAYKHLVISETERKFCLENIRKRKLSASKKEILNKIQYRVLAWLKTQKNVKPSDQEIKMLIAMDEEAKRELEHGYRRTWKN